MKIKIRGWLTPDERGSPGPGVPNVTVKVDLEVEIPTTTAATKADLEKLAEFGRNREEVGRQKQRREVTLASGIRLVDVDPELDDISRGL